MQSAVVKKNARIAHENITRHWKNVKETDAKVKETDAKD